MKKWKDLSARGFALFLALIMCLSAMQPTAFATDGEGDPTEISASEGAGLIPEDADSETNKTVTGSTTTTTTNTTWESTTETPGEYGDPTITGDADKVDSLLGGTDLDDIEDGTYTKTETETKQDITVAIEGEQNRTDTETVDGQGRPTQDSFTLEGEQTTTTTTTDTTKTTTTTVTKETGEDKVTEDRDEEKIVGGEENEVVTKDKDATPDTSEDDLDKVKVTLGNDLFNDEDITSDELTVSDSNRTASSGSNAATSVNTANVTRDFLTALDGWTVMAGDGRSATVRVGENGEITYVDAEENPVDGFQVTLVDNGNGNYSIQAQKVTTTVIEGTPATTDDKGDPVKGEASEIEWDAYELVATVENEDGSVTRKYVRTGTADRTDTNEWVETTTRTDNVTVVTQYATVSATLTNGEYTVSAAWEGVDDRNANNDGIVITALGPCADVIQTALDNRAHAKTMAPVGHIIIANAYKNGNAADLAAAASGGAASAGIKLEENASFIQSSVFIKDASGGDTGAWLRRMSDGKGGYFYVYCAQHGKGTSSEPGYDIVNIDEPGYLYTENANHIQYVVEHGWWGTASGVGSLAEVRKLVTENDSTQIDEGIALAVTQAAIWYYSSAGHDGNKTINPDEDIFTKAWKTGLGIEYENLSDEQKAAAMELFDALTQRDTEDDEMVDMVNKTTDFIHKDDIVSTSVQVVEKVDVSSVDALTEMVKSSLREEDRSEADVSTMNSSNGLYKTSVSITLAVVPSKLNSDNLIIYVYSGETLVGSRRVTAADLTKDNGKVTIENVVLENGANVRFHLAGTQNLAEGAYLFRSDVNCSESQTMVGYVSGSTMGNAVDLDVNMTFSVATTNASATGGATVTGKTETYEETHTTTSKKSSTTKVTENHEQTVTVTTTVTVAEESEDTQVSESVVWNDQGTNTYSYNNIIPGDDDDDDDDDIIPGDDDDDDDDDVVVIPGDDDDDDNIIPGDDDDDDDFVPENPETPVEITDEPTPLAELPEEDQPAEQPEEEFGFPEEIPLAETPSDEERPEEELELPEDDIPLSDVPVTGDSSASWYFMAALSALGLVILTVAGRKREDERR